MTNYDQLHVSFVLATYNRRDVVLETLSELAKCELDRRHFEIILVDNASTDGTPDRVADQVDLLIRLDRNAGSCAKAYGVKRASGRYIVFLDDDSYPRPDTIRRMIAKFEHDPKLGAAGFSVHLPDGRLEGAALPDVFVGCGVGFRAEALRGCGGLDPTFFMQAEEYDLSFRLVAAGWNIKVFDDLHVEHRKTPTARRSARTIYYDTLNNLRVAARYLPDEYFEAYRADWENRYRWIAERHGYNRQFRRGAVAGRIWGRGLRVSRRRMQLSDEHLERFFRWSYIEQAMKELSSAGARRIVFAGLGKNVFAYFRAVRNLGITLPAIGDDGFATPIRTYRDVPVIGLDAAIHMGADAIVVADSSTVHGTRTYHRTVEKTSTPVYHWFHASKSEEQSKKRSPEPRSISDHHKVEPPVAAAMNVG